MSRSKRPEGEGDRRREERDVSASVSSFAGEVGRGVTGVLVMIGKGLLYLILLIVLTAWIADMGFRLLIAFPVALVVLVGGRWLVGWIRTTYLSNGRSTDEPEPEPEPDPEPERWQDIVIDEVRERRDRKYLVLRNTSTEPYDLSGAIITDDAGEEFTFREGLTIEPGDRESLPVEERLDVTPGRPLGLETRSGERYELQWRAFLNESRADR